MLRRPPPQGHARGKDGALVFACPRDNGANALQLRFREGTSSEAGEAPITHSRNAVLYHPGAAERKAALLPFSPAHAAGARIGPSCREQRISADEDIGGCGTDLARDLGEFVQR